MKQKLFNLAILIAVIVSYIICFILAAELNAKDKTVIKLEQPEFLLKEINDTIMLQACEHFGIKYPRIVTAQAILESGYFKSRVFREYNNPFGLYNSKKKDYYKFNHWSDAIIAYGKMVEYKFDGDDYYKFLEELPYALDENYVNKVKSIISKLPP